MGGGRGHRHHCPHHLAADLIAQYLIVAVIVFRHHSATRVRTADLGGAGAVQAAMAPSAGAARPWRCRCRRGRPVASGHGNPTLRKPTARQVGSQSAGQWRVRDGPQSSVGGWSGALRDLPAAVRAAVRGRGPTCGAVGAADLGLLRGPDRQLLPLHRRFQHRRGQPRRRVPVGPHVAVQLGRGTRPAGWTRPARPRRLGRLDQATAQPESGPGHVLDQHPDPRLAALAPDGVKWCRMACDDTTAVAIVVSWTWTGTSPNFRRSSLRRPRIGTPTPGPSPSSSVPPSTRRRG